MEINSKVSTSTYYKNRHNLLMIHGNIEFVSYQKQYNIKFVFFEGEDLYFY
jgi:hypothetical protein